MDAGSRLLVYLVGIKIQKMRRAHLRCALSFDVPRVETAIPYAVLILFGVK